MVGRQRVVRHEADDAVQVLRTDAPQVEVDDAVVRLTLDAGAQPLLELGPDAPGTTSDAAADAEFTAGLSGAAWALAGVSVLGLVVALRAAVRPGVSPAAQLG